VGVSFMFGFDMWQQKGSPVKSAAPCEGTSYEIGGIGLVKGARNEANAKRYYDFLMSATGQALGGKANSLQVPANKTFKLDPRIPLLDNVKLVKHDFVKFGKAEERSRLTQRWQKEVESAPR
jgi:iron(III) transport system substrate-binding protein